METKWKMLFDVLGLLLYSFITSRTGSYWVAGCHPPYFPLSLYVIYTYICIHIHATATGPNSHDVSRAESLNMVPGGLSWQIVPVCAS